MPTKKNSSAQAGSPAQVSQHFWSSCVIKSQKTWIWFLHNFSSHRALVTSLKGCLLYSVSGKYPPLHPSRLFSYEQHCRTELMNWPALPIWYRIHLTNNRNVISHLYMPSLEVVFTVKVFLMENWWVSSLWTVKCEEPLWAFKTFEFCYLVIVTGSCWGLQRPCIVCMHMRSTGNGTHLYK